MARGQLRIDGPPRSARAERYTEGASGRVAQALLGDIDKDTVDFSGQLRRHEREPTVLPRTLPQLAGQRPRAGLPWGMATNVPPHNLGEVIDALLCLDDNPGDHLGRT